MRDALRSNLITSSANTVLGALQNARSIAIATGEPHGVVFERRREELIGQADGTALPLRGLVGEAASPPRADRPNQGTDAVLDIDGVDASSRIYYAQRPPEYLGQEVAYEFLTLADQNNNCLKLRGLFVPQTDGGLLYAAARGRGRFSQLIGAGTTVRIRDGRRERISAVESPFTLGGRSFTGLINVGGPGDIATNLHSFILESNSAAPPCTQVTKPAAADAPPWMGVPGTIVFTTDRVVDDPRRAGLGAFDLIDNAADGAIEIGFQLNPVRSALAPISLPGRAVIDLAVSGSRQTPTQFGVETIVGGTDLGLADIGSGGAAVVARPTAGINDIGDVIVMFAADGSVESIYQDQMDAAGIFRRLRFDAPPNTVFPRGVCGRTITIGSRCVAISSPARRQRHQQS